MLVPRNPEYHYDIEQGTEAWTNMRLAVATASCFEKIVTPTGMLSSQREAYMTRLLHEWISGSSADEWQGNVWTDRGKALEAEARNMYGFETDEVAETCGIVFLNEKRVIGYSPDFVVGDYGLGELKCPMLATHLLYFIRNEIPKEYVHQLQGGLWVTGRKWIDFMSYYPGLPSFIKRAYPDEKYQAALDMYMTQFVFEMDQAKQLLRDYGVQAELDMELET